MAPPLPSGPIPADPPRAERRKEAERFLVDPCRPCWLLPWKLEVDGATLAALSLVSNVITQAATIRKPGNKVKT